MTPDDFLTALEHELQRLAVPFSRGALQTFAADVWPVARWEDEPDAERWAREFSAAGKVTATVTA